jgi:murein DD-endopeptidase MepM/ murein hydrolase activator NlpD
VRRLLRISLILAALVAAHGTTLHAKAQQNIVISLNFDYIRQGTVGLVVLSGPDLSGAQAVALGRTYQFFPNSQGFICLLAVPMDAKIKDEPIAVTVTKRDGSKLNWQGTIKIASGEFIRENDVNLPASRLYLVSDMVQQSEDNTLLSAYGMVTPTRFWEGTFNFPVSGAPSSPFGSWRTYNGIATRRHGGYDFRAGVGTPVLASASGRIVLSRPLDIHGNNIVIDHGWGVFTEYAHLSERYVVPGQFVLQGDVIGLSGNTGRSTGPHLHWEIAVDGILVNPITFTQLTISN